MKRKEVKMDKNDLNKKFVEEIGKLLAEFQRAIRSDVIKRGIKVAKEAK
jgi:Skp family chaperone for outer membrane proteins